MTDLSRYAGRGPRYTSYPTAADFREDVDWREIRRRWSEARADRSVYVHVPFCEVRCFFCGCHTLITHRRDRAERYVDALLAELAALARVAPLDRPVRQLALGGGTPNFLPLGEMERLVEGLGSLPIAEDAERSIECDPRTVTSEYLVRLVALGFNRFSFGVQDLDPAVMAAVNRDQSLATVDEVVGALRGAANVPINFDLIYGLPNQSEASWARTLEAVVALRPSRLAVYGYAHVPYMKAYQELMERHPMPDDALRRALQSAARVVLTSAGYVEIGFDHYALPEDELAQAWTQRTLHRNFMGYTTRRGLDLVALGASGISDVAGTYTQNRKVVTAWEEAAGGEPTWERGACLSEEDRLRREVILDLACNLEVDLARHAPGAERHFAPELEALAPMVADGLLVHDGARLRLTAAGRPFVRHACMAFDQYLRRHEPARFSATT